ncbi:MAG TPA: hypothetical protein VFC93_14195 [Chloroflexota bacterium]|nr:hypothetical protein [Chloroflexota bacterium]
MRYAKVPSRERAVLRAIAANGERTRTRDVEHGNGFPTHAIQPLLASLTRRGLIYHPERGVVAFTTPLFGAFLRRQTD